jgi:hypothetical protein
MQLSRQQVVVSLGIFLVAIDLEDQLMAGLPRLGRSGASFTTLMLSWDKMGHWFRSE